MHSLGEQQEIYPGSKIRHFKRIHQATGVAYEDMVRMRVMGCCTLCMMGCCCCGGGGGGGGGFSITLVHNSMCCCFPNTQVFFDNERWNCREVAELGVVCVYTPDGMTEEIWQEGLQQYAARKAAHKQHQHK